MEIGSYTAIVRGSAFHYPVRFPGSPPFRLGYVKANITSLVDDDSRRRRQTNLKHPFYPTLYVPFIIVKGTPILGTAIPWQIEETTPYYGRKRTWRSSYPHPPQRHKELLYAIMAKLGQELEEIVGNTVLLKSERRSRTAFLSNFPAPLWEEAPEQKIYGTTKSFEYLIAKADLSLQQEKKQSLQKPPRRIEFLPTEPSYR